MMASRKIVSVLTVLIMVSSGIVITASAEEPVSEAIYDTNKAIETMEFIEEVDFDPSASLNNPWGIDISSLTDPMDDYDHVGSILEPSVPPRDLDPRSEGKFFYGDSDVRAGGNVLIIDDDNSDNTMGGEDFNNSGLYEWDTAHLMDIALDDLSIAHDVSVVNSGFFGPTFEELTNYTTVIWMCGFEFQPNWTLGSRDRIRLTSYIEAGGNVWFIGNQMIRSLNGYGNYTLETDSFAYEYMGVEAFEIFTGMPDPINATSNAIMTGAEQFNTQQYFDDPDLSIDLFSNVVEPRTGAFTVLEGDSEGRWGASYDDASLAVGYAVPGRGKVLSMGIGFAAIASAADREDFAGKVMTWMGYGAPSLNLDQHRIMNWYIEMEDHHPSWTFTFNFFECGDYFGTGQPYGWGNLFFNRIASTNYPKTDITITSHFENQGRTNYNNNLVVRYIIYDPEANEVANFTETASVQARKIGELETTFQASRAGFYFVFTNISIAQDPVKTDDVVGEMFRVAKWLDDLENGTDSDWTDNGGWDLTDDAAEANSGTHAWKHDLGRGSLTTAAGDILYSPVIDLRWYNTSYSHPAAPNLNWIWFNFLFTGNIGGAGQDSIDLQFKASNMTSWSSQEKFDSTSPQSDFSSGWFYYIFGLPVGDYEGQTVQYRWVFTKRSQTSTSWWAVDDVCLWMTEEKNTPPWFLEQSPLGNNIEIDVGTTLDLSVWVWDPTDDEPITYEWEENFVTMPGVIGNETTIVIPKDAAPGSKYARGETLDITVMVKDDLMWNSTYWHIKLMDPKPILDAGAPPFEIVINEDEPTPVDFGTSTNIKWFRDPEGQTFTVTADGTTFINVDEGVNNVLTFSNVQPDWNGWDNVTLHVTDSAGSMANFTLPVQVLPVNDAPKWKESRLPDGEQDTIYSFFLTATDRDNSFEQLTFSDDAGFFDISASGEIAFGPTNDHVGYNYFNVTVEDPDGLTDTMELELFINNVNDPPILKYIPPQEANEDEEFTLDVSAYVEDPDLLLPPEFRDIITYRDDTVDLDTNVETGMITWTPDNSDVGELFFTITVTDTKGRSAQQEVKITVYNTNDAPTFGIIGKQNLVQGRAYQFNIPVTDDDLDVEGSGEVLTFTNDNTDLFTIDPAQGSITFTPENEDVGIWEITITVTDSEGASDQRLVVFEIENVNDKPTITYIPTKQLTEDVPFEMDIMASDPDLDPRKLDGEPVDPNEVLIYRTNVSRVEIDSTGKLTFTPTNEDAKRVTMVIRITVVDASSDSSLPMDVTFTIANVNDAPENLQIIGLVPNQKVDEGQKILLRGTAQDIDNDADKLIYKWYSGTTLIGQTQDFTWKVKGKGITVVKLVVSDGSGADSLEASYGVNVTIKQVEEPPGFETMFALVAIAFIGIIAVVSRRRRM